MTGVVTDRQLCEHLSGAQLNTLKARRDKWNYLILPTSLSGCPVRLDRVQGGFSVTYAETMESLRPGDRRGDEPEASA